MINRLKLHAPALLTNLLSFLKSYASDMHRQILVNFFQRGNRDDVHGFGEVCNFQTSWVQKRFLHDQRNGAPFGMDFRFCMGFPLDYFTNFLRPYYLAKQTYAQVVGFFVVIFPPLAALAALLCSGSAWTAFGAFLMAAILLIHGRFWRAVSNVMIYIFSFLPALAALLLTQSDWFLLGPVMLWLTFLSWSTSGLILGIPLLFQTINLLTPGEFVIYWSIAALLNTPFLIANWKHHALSAYTSVVTHLKLQKRPENLEKSICYLAGSCVYLLVTGVTPLGLALILLSAMIYLDSYWINIFNADYWAGVCDMIFITMFIFNPSVLLLATATLVWFRRDPRRKGPADSFGVDLTPLVISKETKEGVKQLFAPLKDRHRIAMEIFDKKEPTLEYYARLTGRLMSIISMVHIMVSNTTLEFMYGIGSWEVSFSTYSDIARKISPEFDRDALKKASYKGRITHVISVTDEYRRQLSNWGFTQIGPAQTICVPEIGEVTLAVHEIHAEPFQTIPAVNMEWGNNTLTMDVEAEVEYRIGYLWHPGWKATIDGHPLPIEDEKPGMRIKADRSGTLILKHSLITHLMPRRMVYGEMKNA